MAEAAPTRPGRGRREGGRAGPRTSSSWFCESPLREARSRRRTVHAATTPGSSARIVLQLGARLDPGALAHDRAVPDSRRFATLTPGAEDRAPNPGPRPDPAAAAGRTEPDDRGPLADRGARPITARGLRPSRRGSTTTPDSSRAGASTLASGSTFAASSTKSPAPSSRAPAAGLDAPLEDVPARLQVALGGADVHPVAIQPVTEQALADEPREDLALDRDHPARRDQVDHARLQHVGAGVHLVGVDLAPGPASRGTRAPRLRGGGLGARGSRPAGPANEAVRARIRDRVQRDGRRRVRAPRALGSARVRSRSASTSPLSTRNGRRASPRRRRGGSGRRCRAARAPRRSESPVPGRRPRRAPRAAVPAPNPQHITTSVIPWRPANRPCSG